MTYWEGVALGVVQGLTEFLPISSSGHLVLAEAALGLRTPGVIVEVAVHLATLLAVVVVYRETVFGLIVGCARGRRDAWRMAALLVIGTLPAVGAALALGGAIERSFDSIRLVGVNLLVTGAILWSTRFRGSAGTDAHPSRKGAIAVGIAQAFALLPGISRSGATVSSAIWLGVGPVQSAEFSFLLAIPAILGAAILQTPEVATGVTAVGLGPLAASFTAAVVTGIFAIRFLVYLLRRGTFYHFAPYCWTVGLSTILWTMLA
ncbi:MAG TPA: undecaprenyl-diphosphate phosphatase [Gemmatimonadales bacterium]